MKTSFLTTVSLQTQNTDLRNGNSTWLLHSRYGWLSVYDLIEKLKLGL